MNPRVFREYDIRGNGDADFPDDFVAELGRAIGAFLADKGGRRITLGRDCRLTSPRIHAVMKRELLASGLDVIDVGIVHTPALYFSVFHLEADGGVMITASHNPGEDNGFKIVAGRTTIYGADIQKLRERIEERAFRTGATPGKASEHDILKDYVAYIANNIQLGPRRFKVVVDGGNGTGGIAAIPILKTLGVDVEDIYCEPDGRFPNHHPDPTVPANLADLIARVRTSGRRGGHRAGRRRRPHRRRRRPGPHHLGRPAGDAVRARHHDAQAGRHLRQRGEVQPGAVRRHRRARRTRHHVEGRALADQGEDEGRERRPGRRDVRAHVLRRALVRLRRRRLRGHAPGRDC